MKGKFALEKLLFTFYQFKYLSSDKGISDFGVDSLTDEVNDIYLKKIEFATQKFSEFLLNDKVCNRDIFQELASISIANTGNSN